MYVELPRLAGIDFVRLTSLCQVLVSILMCLLDWLMVIPVSKLMSKTNEDEKISLLSRVFQVILRTIEQFSHDCRK